MPTHPWPATRKDAIVDTVHGVASPIPYRWLEDEKSPEVAGVDDRAGQAHARRAREAARARRARRAPQASCSTSTRSRPVAPQGPLLLHAQARRQGEGDRLLEAGRGRRGAGAARSEHAGATDGSHGPRRLVARRGTARTSPTRSSKNNSDEATHVRHRRRDRQAISADVIEGTKYAGAVVDARRRRLLLHVGPADRPDDHGRRAPGLRRDPLPQARHRSEDRRARPPGDRQRRRRSSRRRSRATATGCSRTIAHGWTSTDVYLPGRAQGRSAVARRSSKASTRRSPSRPGTTSSTSRPTTARRATASSGSIRSKPERAAWKEIVPQSRGRRSQSVDDRRRAARARRTCARRRAELEVRELDGKLVRNGRRCPRSARRAASSATPTRTGYFAFTSFTEPPRSTRRRSRPARSTEWTHGQRCRSTRRSSSTEQVVYPSKDGTKVSMFIVHRQGRDEGRHEPDAALRLRRLQRQRDAGVRVVALCPWLERGGIYAVPNLRGGGEYGEDWHQAGMLLQEAERVRRLHRRGRVPDRGGVDHAERSSRSRGGSNGGLLVGAAMTQRPDLFARRAVRRAAARHGALPPVRLGQDLDAASTAAPRTRTQFKALYAYSPYHHVDAGRGVPRAADARPTATTASTRCTRASSRRRCRRRTTGDAPMLLRVERNAGHGGADMVKAAGRARRGHARVPRVAAQVSLADDRNTRQGPAPVVTCTWTCVSCSWRRLRSLLAGCPGGGSEERRQARLRRTDGGGRRRRGSRAQREARKSFTAESVMDYWLGKRSR